MPPAWELRPLCEAERGDAAALVWQAFSRKIGTALFPAPKARAVLARAIRPCCAIAVATPEDGLMGLAGFRLPGGAGFVEIGKAELTPVYGRAGALWRGWLLDRFGREGREGELVLETLCVRADLRGRGIGSALIGAVESEARMLGLCAIGLEVADANPRARALYERRGYRAEAAVPAGPLGPVLGFRSATRLVHRL
ncbi:GNAT family N-acetyltransferase [Poseidonocella sp. HB161398]|uniref:GNAT family N-acetyltransferase n=1 Tax=Poseidonocella sp. HB161398 TaxID=2320855 RepID=UPI00110884D8|nr:GNAT family N-acetyltransferase [Poseidonocella sp. HB161398]